VNDGRVDLPQDIVSDAELIHLSGNKIINAVE
jgi:hypothetical protein